ncbi:MAG: ATP-binding cassette domain-containing protein [Desulfatitalea sp.]|nr:ATP-binding cassette domain-containing protein [Desulfatitalea sp.]
MGSRSLPTAATVREPVIVCENLAVGYNGRVLLQGVDLVVSEGAFLPVVGPNGAGKSTLVRAILGLVPPLAGRIRTPFAVWPPGYVAQQKTIDPLYPVSVMDIVLMGAYGRMGWHGRRHRAECRQRAEKLLTDFGLAEHRHKTFDQLSGGMRQKALIARALAGDPRVLVMDEPTAELDHNAQQVVLEILYQASSRDGLTVILVHHGLDRIADMASHVCLVNAGQVRLLSSKEAMF